MSPDPRVERGGAAAVAGALGLGYFATACPFVLGADNGEFATIFAEGGGAHPPGYPLYALYLRAMAWMPAANAAHGSARATALLGMVGVALVYAACRAWGASRPSATLAMGMFGLGRIAWEQLTQAEAFALNVVLCAAFLAAAGETARVRGGTRLVVLGALTGLGAAHHHTLATLMPIGVVAAVRAFREEGARPRDFAAAIVAFVGGISAYLYPVLLARNPAGRWIWGAPSDLRSTFYLFVRGDYWMTRQSPRGPWEQIEALGAGLGEAFAAIGLVFVVAGLAILVVRARGAKTLPRAYGVALVLSVLLAGPALLTQFGGRPIGIGRAVSERFYLLPALLACLAFARGLDVILTRRAHPWRWSVAALAALALYHVVVVRPEVREDERPTIDRYARNLLRSVPPDSVIAGNGDLQIFSVLYMQHAERIRRDVVYVDVGMMGLPWYASEPTARLSLMPGAAFDLPSFFDGMLDAGRPLFVTTPDFTLPPRFALIPWGALFHVVRAEAPAPSLDELEAQNLALARTFAWDETPVKDHWSWSGVAENAYRAPWLALAQGFKAAGRPEDAKRNAVRASRGSLGP